MAKKTAANESIDDKAFQALEDALTIDFNDDDERALLDEMSFEELETQVSQAARELAEADREAERTAAHRPARTTSNPVGDAKASAAAGITAANAPATMSLIHISEPTRPY